MLATRRLCVVCCVCVQIWNGIGGWFGVPDKGMDAVLPGRRHFKGTLFSADDLFVGAG